MMHEFGVELRLSLQGIVRVEFKVALAGPPSFLARFLTTQGWLFGGASAAAAQAARRGQACSPNP